MNRRDLRYWTLSERDIDTLGAVRNLYCEGGMVHCVTQQQPAPR